MERYTKTTASALNAALSLHSPVSMQCFSSFNGLTAFAFSAAVPFWIRTRNACTVQSLPFFFCALEEAFHPMHRSGQWMLWKNENKGCLKTRFLKWEGAAYACRKSYSWAVAFAKREFECFPSLPLYHVLLDPSMRTSSICAGACLWLPWIIWVLVTRPEEVRVWRRSLYIMLFEIAGRP